MWTLYYNKFTFYSHSISSVFFSFSTCFCDVKMKNYLFRTTTKFSFSVSFSVTLSCSIYRIWRRFKSFCCLQRIFFLVAYFVKYAEILFWYLSVIFYIFLTVLYSLDEEIHFSKTSSVILFRTVKKDYAAYIQNLLSVQFKNL